MKHLLLCLFHSLVVLLAISLLVYVLIELMPARSGCPGERSGNPLLTPEDVARLRHLHELDRPLLLRYGAWLGRVLQGDLGYSCLYALPVLGVPCCPLWAERWCCSCDQPDRVALLVAVPLGVAAAIES